MSVTTQDLDGLKKTVAELAEHVKNQKPINEQVEEVLKQVLANHPGFTPPTKAELPISTTALSAKDFEKSIYRKMPKDLVHKADDMFLLSIALKRKPNQLKSWHSFCDEMGDFKKALDTHKKALDTSTAGGVSEWIPVDFSGQFYEYVRLQTKVASLFAEFEQPTAVYTPPVQIGKITTYKQAEATADTGQTKITVGDGSSLSDKVTFTTVKHAARVLISKEAEEDAVIPMLPWLREEIIKAMADGREDALLNGDTAGSHEDSDITDATDRRKLFLGFRALANDNNYKSDLATFNLTALRTMRKNMGRYGVNPRGLAFVTGITGYVKLMGLSEVVTVDKYGPNATVLNGELGSIDNIPIIVSEYVREVLNASGVYQSGQTKTALHLIYRAGYAMGRKRGLTTQLLTELYAESDQDALVATERISFSPTYPIASNHTTDMGYNFN